MLPKPPTRTTAPSRMSAMASAMVCTILLIISGASARRLTLIAPSPLWGGGGGGGAGSRPAPGAPTPPPPPPPGDALQGGGKKLSDAAHRRGFGEVRHQLA